MDAYDIFKKLTKGAKFLKSCNPILNKTTSPIIQDELKIQDEIKKEKNISDFGDSITLLSSIPSNSREKKRKRNEKEEAIKKQRLDIEEINHYRNINRISVVGKNVPEPARTFQDFDIDDDLIANLKSCGYSEPTPIQKQAVPIMLQNGHVLACAPTGSGKTAAFLIPIIHHLKEPLKKGFRAVIICPTRELAKQTQRECLRLSEGRNLKIHIISKINKAIAQYGPNSSKNYDILVTTPNRVCFLLKQDQPINFDNVEWLIIDEADKLFETGVRSFREQLDQILSACPKSRKIAMFSATHTPVLAKWCVHNMKPLTRITIGHRNAAADTLKQELRFVGSEREKLNEFRKIVRLGVTPPVLVFVQSKERAQQLFNELIYDGINVDAIHADRTQQQRDRTVTAFREGKIWVLICTELMARGIDFKGVNLVVNYDFPPSAISYVHRIGRAGRAGKSGEAITFFTLNDVDNLRSIAHVLKESGCEVPDYMLKIKKKNKKERKKLKSAAPQRNDITTLPVRDLKRFKSRKASKILKSQHDNNKNKITKKTDTEKQKD